MTEEEIVNEAIESCSSYGISPSIGNIYIEQFVKNMLNISLKGRDLETALAIIELAIKKQIKINNTRHDQ
jgi:hypothetical protein